MPCHSPLQKVDTHLLEQILTLACVSDKAYSCPEALALKLMSVSKEWKTATRELPMFRALSWCRAARATQISDNAWSSLMSSLDNWLGKRVQTFDASTGCHITSDLLTDAALAYIVSRSPNIETLQMRNCERVTDCGLSTVAAMKPPLKVFSLQWCGPAIYADGLLSIIRSCPMLQVFSISGGQYNWRNLSSCGDELAIELTEHCPNITHLELSDTNIGDGGLAVLAAIYGPCLKSLTLNYTRNWSLWGAQAISDRCKQSLESFSAVNSSLDDTGLLMIARGCHALKHICMSRCKDISLAAVMRALEINESLMHIEISGIFRHAARVEQAEFIAWVDRQDGFEFICGEVIRRTR